MYYNNEEYIVRNIKDIFYKFHIENKNLILEKFKDNVITEKNILEHDVLEYSLDIDEYDKVHIIYVNIKGELNYIIYPKEKEKENILILTGNNVIKDLKMKILYSNVHIFYMINDIDINYLCHRYNYNNYWYHEKISYADHSKYNYPYFIECCNENIYILYCENYSESTYRIKSFNIIDNSWKELEDSLILKHSSNLNFLVTPDNLGIVCFNKSINNNIQTLLKYKDFKNTHSIWSKNISISENGANTTKPKIFHNDNYIYVMWKQGNRIVYKKTKDILGWSEENELNVNVDDIYDAFYRSNNNDDLNLKVDRIYMVSMTFPYPIIQFKIKDSFKYKDNSIKNYFNNFRLSEASITLKDLPKINPNSENNEINEYIKTLIDKTQSQNKNFSYLSKINLDQSNNINILNNSINEYEVKLNNIKADRVLDNDDYFKSMMHYESKVRFLEEEKEELLQSINRKDNDIEEKNNLIKNFNEKFELQTRSFNLFAMLNLVLFKKIALLNHSIDEHMKKAKDKSGDKNKNKNSLNNLNAKLKKEVEIYKNFIDEYEENLHKLKIEKISENQIYMKDINNYENEIRKLKQEREKLLRDLNGKIFSLLTLIEKKETIIQNLRSTRELVE